MRSMIFQTCSEAWAAAFQAYSRISLAVAAEQEAAPTQIRVQAFATTFLFLSRTLFTERKPRFSIEGTKLVRFVEVLGAQQAEPKKLVRLAAAWGRFAAAQDFSPFSQHARLAAAREQQ
jgi:hypothetical protein